MSRHLVDLTNRQIGFLKVKKYVGNKYWRCKCMCGNIKNILGGNLRNAKRATKSCGCLSHHLTSCTKAENVISVKPLCQNTLFNAYVAGVTDSDGSLSLCKSANKSNNIPYRFVAVFQLTWKKSSNALAVMKKLCKIYGGRIHNWQRKLGQGFGNSCSFYKYSLEGPNLKNFLIAVAPHLNLKYKQASLLLKLIGVRQNMRIKNRHDFIKFKPQKLLKFERMTHREMKSINTKNKHGRLS